VFLPLEIHMNYVLWFTCEGPLLALLIGAALAYVEYELIHRGLLVDAVAVLVELYFTSSIGPGRSHV
jgi:hypothetical protein